MGLNDAFSAIRSHFLSLDPFPPLSKIFSLVIQEEIKKGIGVVPNTVATHISETPRFVNAAQGYNGRGRDKLFYTHCQKTNHTVDKYFQLHGFPLGFGRGRGHGSGNSIGDNPFGVQRSVHHVGA